MKESVFSRNVPGFYWTGLLFALLLTACSSSIPPSTSPSSLAPLVASPESVEVTGTPSPLPLFTGTPDPSPGPEERGTGSGQAPTPTLSSPALLGTGTPSPTLGTSCSPLQDIPISALPDHLTNPYAPPPPGSDDPHQGIDLAIFLPDTRIGVPGHPVQAALAGRVAMVLADRFPYGNAVLIESPFPFHLFTTTPSSLATLGTSSPSPLTCPGTTEFTWSEDSQSLYILYAHMQSLEGLQAGDEIACAQPLGTIGDSGNALNPHVHIEMRLGPAGASFDSMAHYTGAASPDEMDAYCAWRVSGLFQLKDPGQLFGLEQEE